jgi:hypothetical protein
MFSVGAKTSACLVVASSPIKPTTFFSLLTWFLTD